MIVVIIIFWSMIRTCAKKTCFIIRRLKVGGARIKNNDTYLNRMFNALEWFAGFTLLQLLKNEIINVASDDPICSVTKTPVGKLYADCSNRQLKSVRRGLGEKLEILNISSNPFQSLLGDDLKEYPQLKELVMRDLLVRSVSEDFFSHLTELNALDISGCTLIKPPKFPSSIAILSANEIRASPPASVENYDFSVLNKLREIYLNDDNLQHLPKLNPKAPIAYIFLNGNNQITRLGQDELARFCQLQQISLERFKPGKQYADSCCYTRVWLDEYNIACELQCDKQCDKEKYPINATAVEIYTQCTLNIEEAESSRTTIYVIIICIVVALLFITGIGYLAYRYYRSSAVEALQIDKKMEKETETDDDNVDKEAESEDVNAKDETVAEEEANED